MCTHMVVGAIRRDATRRDADQLIIKDYNRICDSQFSSRRTRKLLDANVTHGILTSRHTERKSKTNPVSATESHEVQRREYEKRKETR